MISLMSNFAGSVVDSVAFLAIAGFPMPLVWGQVGIKYATTTVLILMIWGLRAVLRQPIDAAGGGRNA